MYPILSTNVLNIEYKRTEHWVQLYATLGTILYSRSSAVYFPVLMLLITIIINFMTASDELIGDILLWWSRKFHEKYVFLHIIYKAISCFLLIKNAEQDNITRVLYVIYGDEEAVVDTGDDAAHDGGGGTGRCGLYQLLAVPEFL